MLLIVICMYRAIYHFKDNIFTEVYIIVSFLIKNIFISNIICFAGDI